jgi:hypothetical protein
LTSADGIPAPAGLAAVVEELTQLVAVARLDVVTVVADEAEQHVGPGRTAQHTKERERVSRERQAEGTKVPSGGVERCVKSR